MAALSRRAKAAQATAATDVAKAVLNETQPGLAEHALRSRRYDRAYEVYRGTAQGANPRDTRAWQSKLRVKYGMQILNENIVSVIQGIPNARCNPRRQQDVAAAKAMEKILGYYTDLDHLAEKQFDVASQAIVYGVSPAKNHWLYREADRTMLAPSVNQETGAVLWTPGTTRIVECDRPTFEPWDVYDCWWEPNARNPDTAAYIVLRSWLTKDDLEKGRYDEDTLQGSYRNLDELYRAGQGQQPPSTAQNRLLDPDTAARYKGRFEIWEVWRDDRLTVIGNRQVVLRDGPKPYWMEGKPIVIGTARPDTFRVEGISETELVDHPQQALWTVHNLRFDQWKMTVLRGATVRETVPDMAQLVFRPSFLWPVTDHDDVKFQDAQPLPPEAYQEDDLMLNRLQTVTGINGYVTGNVGISAARSATGVSILSQAANKPLEFKAEQIRLHVWQRTYEQWSALVRQFLTTDQEFKIEGRSDLGAASWPVYGPQDVYGDYDVKIESSEESLNKQAARAETVGLLNTLAPYAAAGQVNVQPLLEKLAEDFNFPDPEALIPAQPPQPTAAPGLGANGIPNGQAPNLLGGGPPNGIPAQIAPHPIHSLLSGNRS